MQTPKPSASTTSEISDYPNEDRPIDVPLGVIKRLLIDAYKHSNDGRISGAHYATAYWDGYIRALQHVLEAENE